MPSTVEILVSAYVGAKNRRALENMKELRRELLQDVRSASNDWHALELVLDDLRVIEAGLKQLGSIDAPTEEGEQREW
jgi:hypothetical protein